MLPSALFCIFFPLSVCLPFLPPLLQCRPPLLLPLPDLLLLLVPQCLVPGWTLLLRGSGRPAWLVSALRMTSASVGSPVRCPRPPPRWSASASTALCCGLPSLLHCPTGCWTWWSSSRRCSSGGWTSRQAMPTFVWHCGADCTGGVVFGWYVMAKRFQTCFLYCIVLLYFTP